MIKQIVDLHIHSKYSRACSPLLELPNIAVACEQKGIDICATGDYTHPAWFKHAQENLVETSEGIYSLKDKKSKTKFVFSTEVSCIYGHKDKVRRLHLVILAPNISAVAKLNDSLTKMGINIRSDGRPIMGITAKDLLQEILSIDSRFMMIPAHAWTPWFAIFGSKSGYNSIPECFDELSKHIKVIETGLSSDPIMNRKLSQLDDIVLVSNSDAHSLDKLGREANVLAFDNEKEINYLGITNILKSGDKSKFLYTIEFYPEEGMYHVDGHRACGVSMLPHETRRAKGVCPKCGKQLVVGVLNRVDELADREEKNIPKNKFIPHKYIVPLREIIGEAFDVGVKSKKVEREYANMIKNIGNEFEILVDKDLDDLARAGFDKHIILGIKNMRVGNVKISPGFDGQYGKVKTINSEKIKAGQGRLL